MPGEGRLPEGGSARIEIGGWVSEADRHAGRRYSHLGSEAPKQRVLLGIEREVALEAVLETVLKTVLELGRGICVTVAAPSRGEE